MSADSVNAIDCKAGYAPKEEKIDFDSDSDSDSDPDSDVDPIEPADRDEITDTLSHLIPILTLAHTQSVKLKKHLADPKIQDPELVHDSTIKLISELKKILNSINTSRDSAKALSKKKIIVHWLEPIRYPTQHLVPH